MTRGKFFLRCALWGLLAITIVGFVTMLLWNALIPQLFGGPELSYFQALGLLVLSKILFSAFGGKHHAYGGSMPYWKQRYYEKFSSMSPAEREAFKQKMKEKWCKWDQPSGSSGSD